MTRDLGPILAAIDGALADDEFPDAMRWSPEPEAVDDARAPFDGETVWVGPEEYGPTDPRAYGLVEVVLPEPRVVLARPAPEALERLREQARADRARGRVAARARAGQRGPAADLVLFDELYLVDPAYRSEVATAQAADLARAWDSLREVFAATVEQLRPLMESLGQAAAAAGVQVTKFVEEFTRQALAEQRDRPPPPLPDLRRVDPQGYALQLRQSRGTGPDRQVQRQHRPRRHR